MPTSYTRAPSPFWYMFYPNGNLQGGAFATDGQITFYRNDQPNEKKPIYSDPAGDNPLPNPIRLDDLGRLGPNVYFADDELYYLEIEYPDGSKEAISAFPGFGGGGGGSVTVGVETENKLQNGQFRFNFGQEFNPTDEEIAIAQYWAFKKSNTSATDKITFERFNLGDNTVDATPIYRVRYTCTGQGTGETEKDFRQIISDVRTFEQAKMSFSMAVYSDSARTIEVLLVQHFGTGGSPSPDATYVVGSFNLASGDEDVISRIFTVPSVSGKTLGTNGDDYIEIIIRMPLDSTCNIWFTNVYLSIGDKVLPYPRLTKEEEDSKLLGAMIPDIQDGDHGKVITANRDREYSLAFPVPVGFMGEYAGQSYTDDDDWAICHGQTVSVSQNNKRYNRLFNAIGHGWGRGIDSWVTTSNGNKVTVGTMTTDAVTPPSNGSISPGFTITQYAASSISSNRFIVEINNEDLNSLIIKNKANVATGIISNDGGGLLRAASYSSGSAARQTISAATVKSGADISGGKYFMVYNTASSAFSFWYEVNGAGTAPTGSPVKIAINSTDNSNEVALKTAANMAGIQVDIVQTVDAIDIPSGAYININTHTLQYYVWFKVGGLGSDPKISGRIGILVELNSGDTAEQVATKLSARLNKEFFQIPDRRGYFSRGFDPNAVTDFDARMGSGVGSIQYDQVIRHTHPFSYTIYSELDNFNGESSPYPRWSGTATANSTTGTNSGIISGGNETRPVNVAVNYLIKL